jgi:hypothetical protein
MLPPQGVLTAATSTVKSLRIRSARAVAAGSGIVVRFRRRGVRPQRHVSGQEFLIVGAVALLGIRLRERGSPESKPVAAPHGQTGTS